MYEAVLKEKKQNVFDIAKHRKKKSDETIVMS
jgi:hypothetical protein